MSSLKNILKYLNQCYQADNHETGILNFFAAKIEKGKILPEAGSLLNGEMPFLPVGNDKYSQEVQKILQLYQKEKEFFLGALFVICKSSNPNVPYICTPLLMYPAHISEKKYLDEQEGYTITFDAEKVEINVPVLREVIDEGKGNVDDVLSKFALETLNFNGLSKLKTLLEKYTILETENLLMFPELVTSQKLKALIKKLKEGRISAEIWPACGVGIVTKSSETRGLINELDTIVKGDSFSEPIHAVYSKLNKIYKSKKIGMVPSVLSSAQNMVLQSASQYPFSIIVGPPGTGKTYTISSLAIEHVSKGESVLIVSRTDEAVDVVERKINDDINIENITIRGGKSDHLKKLKKYVENLLKGLYNSDLKISTEIHKQEAWLKKTRKRIAQVEKHLQSKMDKNIERSNYLFNHDGTTKILPKIRKKLIVDSHEKTDSLNTLMLEYENLLNKKQDQIARYLSDYFKTQVLWVLMKKRNDLQLFLKSLRARTGGRQEELHNRFNFKTLLKTFPIWLCKISDISRVLPLEKELFDLVIVDEATQCDMASLIPVFQRAKKVVLAGDPNQLKHVSFLSKSRQYQFSEKIDGNQNLAESFNYRNDSILDFALLKSEAQDQVSFLNEHFRSVEPIIRFSNTHFYSNKLDIMTQKPSTKVSEGVKLFKADGKREKNGVNKEEVHQVLAKLRELVDSQNNLTIDLVDTIGILSPFRAQVEAISNNIIHQFTIQELEKHQIMVGTAYSFQGQERDIMLLSLSIDNNSHHSAFIHCNKPDVFNVSITRAKKLQLVYHSLNVDEIDVKYLLRKFLEDYASKASVGGDNGTSLVKDAFMKEVVDEVNKKQWKTWAGFFIAGQVVDILVKAGQYYFGIDLIGYPGEYEEAFTLERYKMLKRAKLQVFPLSYIDWKIRKEDVIKELKAFVKDGVR